MIITYASFESKEGSNLGNLRMVIRQEPLRSFEKGLVSKVLEEEAYQIATRLAAKYTNIVPFEDSLRVDHHRTVYLAPLSFEAYTELMRDLGEIKRVEVRYAVDSRATREAMDAFITRAENKYFHYKC